MKKETIMATIEEMSKTTEVTLVESITEGILEEPTFELYERSINMAKKHIRSINKDLEILDDQTDEEYDYYKESIEKQKADRKELEKLVELIEELIALEEPEAVATEEATVESYTLDAVHDANYNEAVIEIKERLANGRYGEYPESAEGIFEDMEHIAIEMTLEEFAKFNPSKAVAEDFINNHLENIINAIFMMDTQGINLYKYVVYIITGTTLGRPCAIEPLQDAWESIIRKDIPQMVANNYNYFYNNAEVVVETTDTHKEPIITHVVTGRKPIRKLTPLTKLMINIKLKNDRQAQCERLGIHLPSNKQEIPLEPRRVSKQEVCYA